MYERVKSTLLWLLKVPPEPHDPMGDVHSLRVFRAAPGYLRYITIGWALSEFAILLGGLLVFIPLADCRSHGYRGDPGDRPGPPRRSDISRASRPHVLLVAPELRDALVKVTDRSLRIRAGVWNVHEMTMTFANVQNITISQGPLERLFGISDVKVDTAGGGGSSGSHGKAEGQNLHVATFRGVDNPEEIRDLMLQRLRRLRDAGLGDLDDAPGLKGAPVHDPALGSTETLQAARGFSRRGKGVASRRRSCSSAVARTRGPTSRSRSMRERAAEPTRPNVNTPGQVLFASLIGTTIEFFDFYIYATAAVLVFPRLFFPTSDPASAVAGVARDIWRLRSSRGRSGRRSSAISATASAARRRSSPHC